MNTPKPQGLFGLPDLDDVVKWVPGPIADAIKDTVGKILDPADDEINLGDPQPEGEKPIPVDEGTEEMSTTIKAIDAVISALDLVLRVGFVIPDNIEDVIKKLRGALSTIRSWLD